ncbi:MULTISPECIES: TylF/MycF/NovP-related O-methyltransferase [unclassified Rhodococcus (in: high G+C Gram-positive bacteria)]|uniref:TylF/MycF/NovP-related O-methyltransferase n=1 Tax=unclassified Rhodococcus (in: high G+C Gram-positive bacteria) TaxID=192944 RepID=UPI00109DCC52|nr:MULTISPECIES: TylF/MycF/NovP-related O-methyltransferase [unclassified Rhodococcus (in: high G+C Gram-positive bacteria)]QCB49617.1 class I SAM-dependent methyltransferase [Rhodococcus sp. PAMC28705]QCB58692.1 class I SAM-dependent methyltransferase [Rhodococcus sp. PAMC28707]
MTEPRKLTDRLRHSAREKIQRTIGEVLDKQTAQLAEQTGTQQAKLLEILDRQRREIDDLHAFIRGLEMRMRRDIPYASDVEAAAQSAEFAEEVMPKAPTFLRPHATLRFALGEVSVPGMALEFGVASGTTLEIIAEESASKKDVTIVAGFDVFSGLPETWRSGFPKGLFEQENLPQVPGAEIVPGLFEESLPEFLKHHDDNLAFLHLDADLYSSTITVLDLVADRLVVGTVIAFDEYFNFPGWRNHEYRAWTEFVARTGTEFDYLGYTADNEQVVVRIRRAPTLQASRADQA